MNKIDLAEAGKTALDFLSGLVPGALGAAVATAYEEGLTWVQRFTQWAAGAIVAYFAGRLFDAFQSPTSLLHDIVVFSAGLVAYRAVPALTDGFVATLKAIPGDLWAGLKAKLGIRSVSGD